MDWGTIIVLIVILFIGIAILLPWYLLPETSPEMVKRVITVKRSPVPKRNIPSTIYQIHHSDYTTKKMTQAVNTWITLNPTYSYYFYSDQRCRKFIKKHSAELPEHCLDAYDILIPGAYRADLARACIIYLKGGVYIDAGHECHMPLNEYLSASDDLVFVIDPNNKDDTGGGGIYNAFFAAIPHCHILRAIIETIIFRVTNRLYEWTRFYPSLYPTGPFAFGDALAPFLNHQPGQEYTPGIYETQGLKIHMGIHIEPMCRVFFEERKTCQKYATYKREQKWLTQGPYYVDLYHKQYVYRDRVECDEHAHEEVPMLNDIPLIVHQRNETMYVTPHMKRAMDTWRDAIHALGGKYHYYDDEGSRAFIKKHFPSSVVKAYDSLANGTYRCDLFKYCVLYVHGGIAADSGQKLHTDINFLYNTGATLVSALDMLPNNIHCALVAAAPHHPIIAEAIRVACQRIKERDYGNSPMYPTGPGALGTAARNVLHIEQHLYEGAYGSNMYLYSNKKGYWTQGDKVFIRKYDEYESERPILYQEEHYAVLWHKRASFRDVTD